MAKRYEEMTKQFSQRFIKFVKKIINADYSNPKNILLLIAAIIMPFAAWHYISTGMVLGLLKAISILFILDKSPDFIKDLVADHPLLADLILTFLMVVMIGGYFGTGLTLGLGAAFAMIILSWALPLFAEAHNKNREQRNAQFA